MSASVGDLIRSDVRTRLHFFLFFELNFPHSLRFMSLPRYQTKNNKMAITEYDAVFLNLAKRLNYWT